MLADNRIFDLGVNDLSAFDALIAELGDDLDVPGYEDDLLRTLSADAEEIDEMMSSYGLVDEEKRAKSFKLKRHMPSRNRNLRKRRRNLHQSSSRNRNGRQKTIITKKAEITKIVSSDLLFVRNVVNAYGCKESIFKQGLR